MFLRIFIGLLLMKQLNLWTIGNFCPYRPYAINKQWRLFELNCNLCDICIKTNISEILDLNQIALDNYETLLLTNRNLKLRVENKILKKIISLRNISISRVTYDKQMTDMRLEFNTIYRIENDFFLGLANMNSLFLNQNSIKDIEPFSFKDLKKASILSLMSNRLTFIRNNTFNGLVNNVGVLGLESNDISYLELDAFRGLGFKEINLNNNNLKILRKGVFSQAYNLQILYLDSNQIEEIESKTFFDNEKLNSLWLQSNRIKLMRPDIFNRNLNEIKLNSNFIRVFDTESFSNKSSLITFIASNMKIQIIEFKLFRKFRYLQSLDVSNNLLIKIEPNSFSAMSSLKKLNMSHNYLDALEEKLFCSLTSLENLDLSFNEIQVLTKNFLSGLYTLQELHLENNKMKLIEPFGFQDLKSLKNLFLGCNSLTELAHATFLNQTNLASLILNQNCIRSIDFLDALTNLKILDLSSNLITGVEENMFRSTFKTLESLDLNMNRISSFEYSLIGRLKKLKVLKISRIFLSYTNLTEIFVQIPEQLIEIDLSHNTIHFDKEICLPSLMKLKNLFVQNVSFYKTNNSAFEVFFSIASIGTLDVSYNDLRNFTIFFRLLPKNSLYRFFMKNCSLQSLDSIFSIDYGPYDFDFSHNNLSIFPRWQMGGWAGHRFDLSYNRISSIEPGSFSIYVEYINLDYNRIISLNSDQPYGIWSFVGRINILKLSHNRLGQIPPIESESIKDLYLDHNNLTDLRVFNHKNEQIEFLKFRKTSLILLCLDFNRILSIENNAFQHLKKLENFSISYNYLTRIHKIDFFYQYQLKFLNLSHNRIHFIEFDSFENLNNLLSLDLSFNNLTSIENKQFKGLDRLASLFLNNNQDMIRLNSQSFDYLLNIRNIHLDELVVLENECMLVQFKNEFKAERNVNTRYSFYRSLNLISPKFTFDKNQSLLCDFTFELLQFRIHFNLKSDNDNEFFYEKCKLFIIKKSNYFLYSKKNCFNETPEISYDDDSVNMNGENAVTKVLSNLYFLGTIFAILLLLVPGFIYICMNFCDKEYKSSSEKLQKIFETQVISSKGLENKINTDLLIIDEFSTN
jgi:Leucine-rich repeat (LRR) protein